jgi:hypothetical protein
MGNIHCGRRGSGKLESSAAGQFCSPNGNYYFEGGIEESLTQKFKGPRPINVRNIIVVVVAAKQREREIKL